MSPRVTLEVGDAARRLARILLRSARDGALGVVRPKDGIPAVSRVLVATDFAGRPVLLVSDLSLHSRAIATDPRCSLLVGQRGKGDPLAHPRMTVFSTAIPISRESDEGQAIRERFLSRHPTAALYVDFPDFRFLRLEPQDAALNGGFARAYDLSVDDFIDEFDDALPALGIRARDHMNEDHADSIDTLAGMHGESGSGWRIATVDRRGFEIRRGDRLSRIEFNIDPKSEGGYRAAFVDAIRNPPADNAETSRQ
ncbi:HugZ family protein [Jiella mangrovi]|uniref:HugZ family protein n=1 Tax=Jiella mangrovi TaxID=2821407 RepID=A0ABS4BCB2_9HYPH|nr:DUF2470 domain-containing protein [Jiella mangrovi]MBP0614371.1 HugZ family protein [Jiella mangrovi]